MYLPKINQENDLDTIFAFMQENSFVTLVSNLNNKLIASHIPVTLERDSNDITIWGHLAKANPHCEAFDEAESLIIFNGPHAYISPAHYDKKESVPTWNYAVVHAYGTPQKQSFKENLDIMKSLLLDLIRKHEQNYEKQWDDLSKKYKEGMMQGIIGFKLKIEKLEAKYKLSQNKSKTEQTKITQALLASPETAIRSVNEFK